jgi:hypothetical protein
VRAYPELTSIKRVRPRLLNLQSLMLNALEAVGA